MGLDGLKGLFAPDPERGLCNWHIPVVTAQTDGYDCDFHQSSTLPTLWTQTIKSNIEEHKMNTATFMIVYILPSCYDAHFMLHPFAMSLAKFISKLHLPR
jgi:hypothetical protein